MSIKLFASVYHKTHGPDRTNVNNTLHSLTHINCLASLQCSCLKASLTVYLAAEEIWKNQ